MSATTASRWQIVTDEGPPGGGLYELEGRTTWHVVDRQTRATLHTFEGRYSASYQTDGSGWGPYSYEGVVAVELSEDGQAVVVREADGQSRRIALPG